MHICGGPSSELGRGQVRGPSCCPAQPSVRRHTSHPPEVPSEPRNAHPPAPAAPLGQRWAGPRGGGWCLRAAGPWAASVVALCSLCASTGPEAWRCPQTLQTCVRAFTCSASGFPHTDSAEPLSCSCTEGPRRRHSWNCPACQDSSSPGLRVTAGDSPVTFARLLFSDRRPTPPSAPPACLTRTRHVQGAH